MKRLNFRHPRYALPLIILPFLVLLNYLWRDMRPAPTAVEAPLALTQTAALNTTLPDASLSKRDMKDKFAAFQDEFKYRTDYSAIQELGEEGGDREETAYGSMYSEEERRRLDSLQQQGFMERVSRQQRVHAARPAPVAGQPSRPAAKAASDYEKEIRLFREQMLFIDSLNRAGEEPLSSPKGLPPPIAPAKEAEKEAPLPLPVSTSGHPDRAYFNTVTAGGQEPFIRAMLDEGLGVMQGGRIRIRLLDDIYVSGYEIKKGSYLYGTVSGFSAQRVEVAVRSILYGAQIIPVDLRLYDHDGLAGLYVPDSEFRDFTRELAGNAGSVQPVTFGDSPDNAQQMLYAMLERMSQTASRAAGRAFRKNKARLKYNTLVYLIDNKAR